MFHWGTEVPAHDQRACRNLLVNRKSRYGHRENTSRPIHPRFLLSRPANTSSAAVLQLVNYFDAADISFAVHGLMNE
jgi:hypothetical protein